MERIMLLLARKQGEKIDIDDGLIVVTVHEIRRDCVVLGFEAPRNVRINRREVTERIEREE
jgi:carbon storage regulator